MLRRMADHGTLPWTGLQSWHSRQKMNMADKGQAPLKCVFDRLVRMRQPGLCVVQILPFLEKAGTGQQGDKPVLCGREQRTAGKASGRWIAACSQCAEHEVKKIFILSEKPVQGSKNESIQQAQKYDHSRAANCIICTMVAHLCRIVLDYKKRTHKPGECYEKLTKYCLYYC